MKIRPHLLLAVPLLAAISAGAETPVEAAPAAAGHAVHAEWGYEGPGGPEHWAELSEDYQICTKGQQESPIDLRSAVPARLDTLKLDWTPVALKEINNGHTLQMDAATGGTLVMAGTTYRLAQFHLHHPSEHLLAGRRFPLEVHFVHKGPDGVLGVVGVFVKEGHFNPTLQKVLAAMPAEAGASAAPAGTTLDLKALLPKQRGYFRYEGSLTTPPCSESVDWVVLDAPIEASKAQIEAFAAEFPMNARPLQALNRRFLLHKS